MKNTQFYTYYGGIFIERNTALDVNESLIGYGYTGSANSQNRASQELTLGINQVFWKDPKYGALTFMCAVCLFLPQSLVCSRNAPKNAHEHTVWFNLRYTLPGSSPTVKY